MSQSDTNEKIDLAGSAEITLRNLNQNEVSSALSRLLVTVEQYPTPVPRRFYGLLPQLEGKKIVSSLRNKFNEAARV